MAMGRLRQRGGSFGSTSTAGLPLAAPLFAQPRLLRYSSLRTAFLPVGALLLAEDGVSSSWCAAGAAGAGLFSPRASRERRGAPSETAGGEPARGTSLKRFPSFRNVHLFVVNRSRGALISATGHGGDTALLPSCKMMNDNLLDTK